MGTIWYLVSTIDRVAYELGEGAWNVSPTDLPATAVSLLGEADGTRVADEVRAFLGRYTTHGTHVTSWEPWTAETGWTLAGTRYACDTSGAPIQIAGRALSFEYCEYCGGDGVRREASAWVDCEECGGSGRDPNTPSPLPPRW